MAGFEGATMVFADGRRVDAIEAVGHAGNARHDYGVVRDHGIRSIRDSLRWHLIERTPYQYDWSSFLPMLRAARDANVQPVWDLCHFGMPSGLDPWSAAFIDRFAALARQAARIVANESDKIPVWAPINEISFWSFAGGDRCYISPFAYDRGAEWKRQLSRAAIAACHALREIDPRARLLHTDPVIHVVPAKPHDEDDIRRAEERRQSMFVAWDQIAGRRDPELGGSSDCLDIVGVNFYPMNEFNTLEEQVGFGTLGYRPFSDILGEVAQRYARPIVVSETGAEAASGAAWFRHIHAECVQAMENGVRIDGLCLYPIMDYVGWSDDRHCRCGLIELDGNYGERHIDPAMAAVIAGLPSLSRPGVRAVNL